ncbi:hypothetical protein DFP73DRAFT_583630 [Morchella snyderi]|nr:hypothetical protein DFP73DRAFT_583630 [Morchella snyderi]
MTTRTVATPNKSTLTPYRKPSKRKLREEAALQETRVKEARSLIIAGKTFVPDIKKGQDVQKYRGKGRTLAEPLPRFDENSCYLQSNEISPYFAWTEKLDIDRASLLWWVRVPTRPNITHHEYMKQTRSVARTTKLLKAALRTMQTPENQRTKEMNMGLFPAIKKPIVWEPIYLSDWEEHMSWGPKEVLKKLSSGDMGEERRQKITNILSMFRLPMRRLKRQHRPSDRLDHAV